MDYKEFVDVYENLGKTSGRLNKTTILAEFMLKLKGNEEWSYLLQGHVLPSWDGREFGISRQLVLKVISEAYGISLDRVKNDFNKIGDLGEIAKKLSGKKKQVTLGTSKLKVKKVFDNLVKLLDIEGKGAVSGKLDLIKEVLASAEPNEAKYVVRTLLNDLRVGVQIGVVRDSLAKAFFPDDDSMKKLIGEKLDLSNDLAEVMRACAKGEETLADIDLKPGRALQTMLAVPVKTVEEAFKVCGMPAAFEFKYDGFRVLIHKDKKGNVKLFTRNLEEVTNQFPDVVEAVKSNVKGGSFILDSEVVGFDRVSRKYKPFEAISQRIKRKYEIEKLVENLPVEVNVFDVLYLNGKNKMSESFVDRRKIVEDIVNVKDFVIKPSRYLVSGGIEEAGEFYQEALDAGEEGVMIKSLDKEYQQGRRVGYMAKLKPVAKDLDLVIVGAEHGTGKRAGALTSYIVACQSEGKFLEVGKVASGLKEKKEEGFTYGEMSKLLEPLVISKDGNEVRVKPEVVVSVTYQNLQPSTTYASGYALRFPRITKYRPDKGVKEIASLDDIQKESK